MASKKGTLSRAASLAHQINAALGTDVRLGDDPSFQIVRIPTGSLVLDRVTGGGFALGRHVELYGDESACKSYISYRCMAASQARGNLCALVDPEHAFDPDWFRYIGGHPEELLTFHPVDADEAVAVMMLLAKHAEEMLIEVITIDSVASLVPRESVEIDPRKEERIGAQARLMSRALRRITTVNDKILFLWINQERTDVAVKFGNPRTTPGGRALRYYATTRIEMRRAGKVTGTRTVARAGKLVEAEVPVGRWIQVRCEKDKSTRPYREGSFVFDAERSEISRSSEIIQLGQLDGLITRSGPSYSYGTRKGSYTRFSKYLDDHPDLAEELVGQIMDQTVRESDGD